MKLNTKIEKDFSVIVLAAGKSKRLGFPKLALKFDERITFIEHIVNEYLKCCKEIIVVVNEESYCYLKDTNITFPEKAKTVINTHPEWHRFYSLKLGVQKLSEKMAVFVHNVDNPFVNQEVLNELILSAEKADYLIPQYDGSGGHPILISKNVVKNVNSMRENQLHFKEFLNQYSKHKVLVSDENILVNINTNEDYNKYF